MTVGITLTTSSPTLSSSSKEPFYIIVSARVLTTPSPNQGIVLATFLSPLSDLSNRSFENIICTPDPTKRIEIYPHNWPHFLHDPENLRAVWEFVDIPPLHQGSYSVRHQVPPRFIEAANLQAGERYRVALTNKCLGTRWWEYGKLTDLDGVRLRWWRTPEEDRSQRLDDPLTYEEILEKHGDGPTSVGQQPDMLALLPENDGVEFEIVE